MAEISNNYYPQSNLCKFGARCNRENCWYSHEATILPRTPYVYEAKKVERKQTPLPGSINEPCAYWAIGKCKNGENCPYMHPPKKPNLSDVLEHQNSDYITPNDEDGISYTTPPYPGLPQLPQNGKCRIMHDSDLIIYFIPFFKPIDNVVYFKKIRLYRFNKKKGQYVLVFNYNKQGFHITSAAASNGYLVCSRLPYDAAILRIMEEAKRLKNSQEKLHNVIKKKDENHARQMAQLRQKNRDLSEKIKRRPVSTLRVEAQIRFERKSNNRLEWLFDMERDYIRNADPVDLFVYDSKLGAHVHVLEYHKPSDHVDLQGKNLFLWDKKTGLYHYFKINLLTQNVSKFQLDEPIQPKQLCDVF